MIPIDQDMASSQLESLTKEPTCSQGETEKSSRDKQVEKNWNVLYGQMNRNRFRAV